MENLTGGNPPVRPLPCVVPCKLYFSLFEISISQFEDLDFEAQYLFQHELFDALAPVIRKHFKMDAYGRTDMPDLERIISDLEDFRDEYYLHLYADEVLRKKYSEKPPRGKTKKEILKIDAEDLVVLDMYIQDEE